MKSYAIVTITDMELAYWADVFQLPSTIRYDFDTGDTGILSWTGSDPAWLSGLTSNTYTLAGLLTQLGVEDIWEPT